MDAIVDGEPFIRTLLRRMREMEAFQVTEAASIAGALRILAHANIDLTCHRSSNAGTTGVKLAETARAAKPELPFVL